MNTYLIKNIKIKLSINLNIYIDILYNLKSDNLKPDKSTNLDKYKMICALSMFDKLNLYEEYTTNELLSKKLSSVHFSQCKIVDISPLSIFTELLVMELEMNYIIDISPLAKLPNLKKLYLGFNDIIDISPLSNLLNLTVLDVEICYIKDITPLYNLTNLKKLNLSYNEIEDITPLYNLTRLTELNIDRNYIRDISQLTQIKLTKLDISHNKIIDMSSLTKLVNLKSLEISYDCNIPVIDLIESIPSLTKLIINHKYKEKKTCCFIKSMFSNNKFLDVQTKISDFKRKNNKSSLTNLIN